MPASLRLACPEPRQLPLLTRGQQRAFSALCGSKERSVGTVRLFV